ncbi:type VII secretion-associated serine protease mycosin [Actinoplanes derwentensis]|uniref:Type VII secretion-associated serine protease mycosin n=1 Tax=Actinoplanes derwentensis TaxID=113562 RepID=A0A1H2CVV1_9ACTN|nr:type VII secretion-associated serine protease mycosin [Actinoplanes derwentensis]GID90235.1 hypothetical protein Ade03nite_91590 [Actinoplanes derwentensis]SDT74603.1 type VII secretion-associated serine protease mycosin [Actinoplanes derwentensis]
MGLVLAAAPAVPDVPPLEQPGGGTCAPPAVTVATAQPWAVTRMAVQRAWPVTRGKGVRVAVVDSGVDGTHPQLNGRVANGFDVLRQRAGADTDCVGHGTFVAGIIGAAPVKGTPFAGVAPDVTIVPYRQSDSGQGGNATGLARGIVRATKDGADVINVSVAAVVSSETLRAAVAYAEKHDVLVVAAVANEAANGNPVAYPAAYPDVLGVGAVDQDGARAAFSGTGSDVDLVAPGVQVVSTGPRGPGHLVASGTSFSTPYVAGVAALVRAAHPDLTAAQVRHRLEATADHPARSLPDSEYGWGVVNAYAAVTAVLPEEAGAAAGAPKPHVVPAAAATGALPPATVTALAVAAGSVLLAGAALAGRRLLAQGRRRRWRPAGSGKEISS